MNDHNLIPAKKGEVRNPNGRPHGAKNRSTVVRQILAMTAVMPDSIYAKIRDMYPEIAKTMTVEEMATLVMVNRAITKQDPAAYKAIMDSAYGLPKQTIETETLPPGQRDPRAMTDEEIQAELARLEAEETDFEMLSE